MLGDVLSKGQLTVWYVDGAGAEKRISTQAMRQAGPFDWLGYFGTSTLSTGRLKRCDDDLSMVGAPLWIKKEEWSKFLESLQCGLGEVQKPGRPNRTDEAVRLHPERKESGSVLKTRKAEAAALRDALSQRYPHKPEHVPQAESIARAIRRYDRGQTAR